MPVFNVSFLNPKNRTSAGGSGYSTMNDELSILKNTLQGDDGFLSPGDYDLLTKKAKQFRMNPSLTNDQASSLDVKISEYQTAKNVLGFKKADDIDTMKNGLKNEAAQDVYLAGNNPKGFLEGRLESLKTHLNDLGEIINRRQISGDDVSAYQNEYNDSLREYGDRLETYNALAGFDNTNPVQGFAAYVKTNNRGEIIDVDYGKFSSQSGYAATNAMIGGFQVYGKVNGKDGDKSYFQLGDKKFQAADIDMTNMTGGTMPSGILRDSTSMKTGKDGKMTQAVDNNFINMDVPVQSYIPADSYAKGVNGTVYKRRADGGYTKYVNVDPAKLGDIPNPDSMITLPKEIERSILPQTNDCVDFSESGNPASQFSPDIDINQRISNFRSAQDGTGVSMDPTKLIGGSSPFDAFSPQPEDNTLPMSTPETPTPSATSTPEQKSSPIRRTPQQPNKMSGGGIMDIAKKTVSAGADYLKSVFNS